jgi:predicted dehydrogenase
MQVYSVGVIGTGTIARQVHLPVLATTPNARVAWVADVVADSARRVGRAYGVPHIALSDSLDQLPQCDAVLLAIPVGARNPYYPILAKQRIGVLVEKPFATSIEEHRRIVGQFEPNRIACGLMRRTYANTLLLQAMVQEEWFGPLEAMCIAEGGRAMRTGTDRTYLDNRGIAGGGVLLDLGCHTLDLALFITRASAYEIVEQEVVQDGDIDRKVTATIQLRNVGGRPDTTCRLEYCVSWLDPLPNSIQLMFPEATVVVGTIPEARMEIRPRRSHRVRATIQPSEPAARTSYQAFFLEWESFLRGLSEGKASMISAQSCEMTTMLIADIYQRGAVSCPR